MMARVVMWSFGSFWVFVTGYTSLILDIVAYLYIWLTVSLVWSQDREWRLHHDAIILHPLHRNRNKEPLTGDLWCMVIDGAYVLIPCNANVPWEHEILPKLSPSPCDDVMKKVLMDTLTSVPVLPGDVQHCLLGVWWRYRSLELLTCLFVVADIVLWSKESVPQARMIDIRVILNLKSMLDRNDMNNIYDMWIGLDCSCYIILNEESLLPGTFTGLCLRFHFVKSNVG